MKIIGLGEKLTDIKGMPFVKAFRDKADGPIRTTETTFGEWLFELALEEKKGVDAVSKFRQFKTAEKISNAAFEVDLDQVEIDSIKEAAGSEAHNIQFYGRICRVLDEGGIAAKEQPDNVVPINS